MASSRESFSFPGKGSIWSKREPRVDSVEVPGTPLVLVRGETAAITVINRLPEATTVHWHGMELESVYDGVAGWSRTGDHTAVNGGAASKPIELRAGIRYRLRLANILSAPVLRVLTFQADRESIQQVIRVRP